MTKLSRKKVVQAIENSLGNYSLIAQRCGSSRQAVHQFLHKPDNKDLLLLAEEDREKLIDKAELKLVQKIDEGDSFIIWKILSTRGKNRGYGDEPMINQNQNYTFKIIEGKNENSGTV